LERGQTVLHPNENRYIDVASKGGAIAMGVLVISKRFSPERVLLTLA